MAQQPDLFPPVTPDDKSALRAHLHLFGWQTRKQLCRSLGWTERKVRDVAEAMGTDIVRGQTGFKLMEDLRGDDLAAAVQARDAAISQGKKMIRYGIQLGRRIHTLVG